MASAIAATYGGVDLSTLTSVTRETANPLYPGAVSAKVAAAAGAGAKSGAAIAALTTLHGGWAMEGWVYLPAAINVKSMPFCYARDATTPYEGYGMGIGDVNYGSANASANIASLWKTGVQNYGGASGVGGAVSATHLARNCDIPGPAGWHHFAFSHERRSDSYPTLYIDGKAIEYIDASTDTNHGAFTSAARAVLFNDPAGTQTPTANVQVAQVYLYARPLKASEVHSRITLVDFLNAA